MKSYRFYLTKWASPTLAKHYRAVLKDWIAENDGEKTPLYIRDDVYVWATDKDMLHMVLTDNYWDALPSVLCECGSDILDVLIDHIENRDVDDESLEDELLDYITD